MVLTFRKIFATFLHRTKTNYFYKNKAFFKRGPGGRAGLERHFSRLLAWYVEVQIQLWKFNFLRLNICRYNLIFVSSSLVNTLLGWRGAPALSLEPVRDENYDIDSSNTTTGHLWCWSGAAPLTNHLSVVGPMSHNWLMWWCHKPRSIFLLLKSFNKIIAVNEIALWNWPWKCQ